MIKEDTCCGNKNDKCRAACKRCFLAGAANLEAKKEFINELNVFPVPDGDTGTNMTLDDHVCGKGSQRAGTAGYADSVSKAISSGSLRGAEREFRSYPVAAFQRFYKRDPGI